MRGAPARGVVVFGVVLEGLGAGEGEVPVADARKPGGDASTSPENAEQATGMWTMMV